MRTFPTICASLSTVVKKDAVWHYRGDELNQGVIITRDNKSNKKSRLRRPRLYHLWGVHTTQMFTQISII